MAAKRSSTAKAKKSSLKRSAAAPEKKAKRHAIAKVAAPSKGQKESRQVPTNNGKPAPVAVPSAAARKGEIKPGKIVGPLSKAELHHFRDLLLAKRREILGDVGTMESEAFKAGSNLSNMPIHMADVGTDNFEQEFTLGLIESERKILREIQEALGRVEDSSYGICLGTGKPIPKVRLEAVPWAKYSLDYAKALESGQIQRDSTASRDDEGDDDEE
jgi:RNA polymerase-binding protein DksA